MVSLSSKYLINKLKETYKDYASSYGATNIYFIFKNFYITYDKNKKLHRIWTNDDLNDIEVEPSMNLLKRTIVGLSIYDDGWMTNWIGTNQKRAIYFSYPWKEIGKFHTLIDNVLNAKFNQFIDSLYDQLIMHINSGEDIVLSSCSYLTSLSKLIFKKNSTYEVLTETDLIT